MIKQINSEIKTYWNVVRNCLLQIPKIEKHILEIGLNIKNNNVYLSFYLDRSATSYVESQIEFVVLESLKKLINNPLSVKLCFLEQSFNKTIINNVDDFIENLDLYYFKPELTNQKYIFKYSAINDNLNKLLINSTLWFGQAKYFNDSFDSRYLIQADPTNDDMMKFYWSIKYNRPYIPNGDNPNFSDFKASFKPPSNKDFISDLEKYHFSKVISPRFGVCCFTENCNEQLMWSHYADSCKGVCLVFDRSKATKDVSKFNFRLNKIRYRKNLPTIFWDSCNKVIGNVFHTKLENWKYEKELRKVYLLEDLSSDRSVEFDPETLIGIIFGHNCNDSEKLTIQNLVKQLPKYKNVQYWEAVPNIQEQRIDIDSGNINFSETMFL
nr:DUF2971 domain-containing protein [uncultured Marinifilum sp.]